EQPLARGQVFRQAGDDVRVVGGAAWRPGGDDPVVEQRLLPLGLRDRPARLYRRRRLRGRGQPLRHLLAGGLPVDHAGRGYACMCPLPGCPPRPVRGTAVGGARGRRSRRRRHAHVASVMVDIWSDIHCPWALIAVHRLRTARDRLGLDDVFVPRAWPLEWVNGRGTPRGIVTTETAALAGHEPELFNAYRTDSWPSTFLPAFELVAAARRLHGVRAAEDV